MKAHSSTIRALYYIFFTIALSFLYIYESHQLLSVFNKSYPSSFFYHLIIFSAQLIFSFFLIALSSELIIMIFEYFTKKIYKVTKTLKNIIAVFSASLISLFFIIDIKVFETTGLHIHSPFAWDNIKKSNIQDELHFSTATIVTALLFIIVVFTISTVILKLFFIIFHKKNNIFIISQKVFVVCFGLLWFSAVLYTNISIKEVCKKHHNLAITLPFYEIVYDNSPSNLAWLTLKYPIIPTPVPTLKNKKNILIIQLESFRSEMIAPETTPHISNFINTHPGNITSQHHHSGELSTVYGTFSLLYGLNIYHFGPFADHKIKSFPFEILRKNNYITIGATASGLKGWERKIDFMFENFDTYKEFKQKGWRRDEKMVSWIKKRYAARDTSKPHLFFLFFNVTHHNYFYPQKFEYFKPAISQKFNYFRGDTLKKHKTEVYNRYKNSVRFADYLISQLFEVFKEDIENENLIIVITGDHGEEFWDTGKLGHGKISNNARSQVPLLIHLPRTKDKKTLISSHVDILPTIIDYLNPTPDLSASFYSNGLSLINDIDPKRYITIGGFDFPRRSTEVTLVSSQGKIFLKKEEKFVTKTNTFRTLKITDLNDNLSTDPAVQQDLLKKKTLFKNDIKKFFR